MTDRDPISRLNPALEGRYHFEREFYVANDLKHEREGALKALQPELAAGIAAGAGSTSAGHMPKGHSQVASTAMTTVHRPVQVGGNAREPWSTRPVTSPSLPSSLHTASAQRVGGTASIKRAKAAFRASPPAPAPVYFPIRTTTRSCVGIIVVL